MHRREVQARILATEFDNYGRVGLARTSPDKTPVISYVLIPLIEEDTGEKLDLRHLFRIPVEDGARSAGISKSSE